MGKINGKVNAGQIRESRWDKSNRDKPHIFKNLLSLWPRNTTFLPGLESNPHVCTHVLQSQPHPPGEGVTNLLRERCRLSVSHAGLQVVLPVYVFHPDTGTQLLVWFLLLASIHPPVPSAMLSLPDIGSRLSPEGRLTRGWCTLAFPTSDWNVHTGIFCGWKMGEYSNVRQRFDFNTSKSHTSQTRWQCHLDLFILLLLILPPKQVFYHHV